MTLSWAQALNRFELYLKESGLAQNTVASYRLDVRSFVNWLQQAECSSTPDTFSSLDVAAYKLYLQEAVARPPASINRVMQSLRKFGRFLQAMGLQQDNPAQKVPLLALSSPSTIRVLTQEQVQHLMEIAEAPNSRNAARDLVVLHLLLRAGLRAREITLLQMDDLQLGQQRALLTIRQQGRTAARTIPLSRATQAALQDFLDQRRPSEPGCPYLLFGRDGGPLSIRSVQQSVANLGKAARLDLTAKSLRDFYARELWKRTGDFDLLVQRLGIRRPETAVKYITARTMA
ncbi:MAG: tyrosine-type recombinase/integrase [Chloroflexota bacterium]|nr:tyrosine-type recombinase/integrase [Chloroflexota bacterium]